MAIYNMGQGGSSSLGLCQKVESRYVTTQAGETEIPIDMQNFRLSDALFVDVNGLMLIKNVDYTIDAQGDNIILTSPIDTIGTIVHFMAMRLAEIDTDDYAKLKGDDGRVADVYFNGVSALDDNNQAIINAVDIKEALLDISDYQETGSDDEALYNSIIALGWNDVLE